MKNQNMRLPGSASERHYTTLNVKNQIFRGMGLGFRLVSIKQERTHLWGMIWWVHEGTHGGIYYPLWPVLEQNLVVSPEFWEPPMLINYRQVI